MTMISHCFENRYLHNTGVIDFNCKNDRTGVRSDIFGATHGRRGNSFFQWVQGYQSDQYVKHFSCLDQYLVIAFAQLTYRESLRDIKPVFVLKKTSSIMGVMGIRARTSRRTMADTNEHRDWRIYPDFARSLIKIARPLYAKEDLGLDLENSIYSLSMPQ